MLPQVCCYLTPVFPSTDLLSRQCHLKVRSMLYPNSLGHTSPVVAACTITAEHGHFRSRMALRLVPQTVRAPLSRIKILQVHRLLLTGCQIRLMWLPPALRTLNIRG